MYNRTVHVAPVFVMLCILQGIPRTVSAQWSADSTQNTPIAVQPYNQYDPAVVSDGAGGMYVTWTDQRDGLHSQIYCQRLNASGINQYITDGFSVCQTTADQENSVIVGDGSGGILIAWADYRGDGDVYMQRVGGASWGVGGVAVSATTGTQKTPSMVPDGIGGAVVAWFDSRSGSYGAYAQRINHGGTVRWTTDGVAVCTNILVAAPVITTDGARGAILSWKDNTHGVCVQRVDSEGTPRWTANGVRVTTVGATYSPAITSDGSGGAILTWYDTRNGTDDIFAQRFDSSGAALWTTNGVTVCDVAYNQTNPVILGDGAGGSIIVWVDTQVGPNAQIYAQRLDASGNPQWAVNGVAICTAAGNQDSPVIVSDGAGGAIIAWMDSRTGSARIYAQSVNASGVVQWTTDGIGVCTATSAKGGLRAISDNAGGMLASWGDYRNGDSEIFGQHISGNSALPVELVSFIALPVQSTVELSWSTATEADNYGFGIERRGIQGSSPGEWTNLGLVHASGTCAIRHEYTFIDRSLSPGRYAYRLRQIDLGGGLKYSEESDVEVGSVPIELTLGQNYPNPFNPITTLQFSVPADGHARLTVFDVLGREVATLFDGELKGGVIQRATFDASALSSGLYFSRLEFNGAKITKRMMLVR